MAERLLMSEEVAEILRVPVTTLQDWRYRGVGPRAARIGRRVMYRASDVDRWIEAAFTGERTA